MTSPYLSFLYTALASKFGVSLSVSDPTQAKAALYKARKEASDLALDQISIHQSPFLPDDEIWLVKRPRKAGNGPVSVSSDAEEPGADNGGTPVSPSQNGPSD